MSKLKDWIESVVRWCCQKPKKKDPVVPVQRQVYGLTALAASFAIAGQPSTLTYDQHEAQNYTLTAQAGSMAITGKDAGLSGSTHVLGASRGVFTLTGSPASLRYVSRARASAGAFTLSGKTATLRYGRKVHAVTGAFTINGKANALGYSATATDPESILDKGLSTVYHLAETTGPTASTYKTPSLNLASLPIGTAVGLVGSSPCVYVGGSASFTGWDFRGYTVSVDGSITASFTDCYFQAHMDYGFQAIYGGQLSGTSGNTVNLTRCSVDGATNLPPTPSTTNPHPPQTLLSVQGSLNASYSKFVNAASATLNIDGGNNTLDHCYFGCPGIKVYVTTDVALNSHFEQINFGGGTNVVTNSLFDCADLDDEVNLLVDPLHSGPTGLFLLSARVAHIDITFTNNVLLPRNLHMYYAQQIANSTYGVNATYTNNVVGLPITPFLGTGGYFANDTGAIHGSGNVDFSTALPASELNI